MKKKDKNFKKTLTINYIMMFVISASPLIAIPFYLKIIGIEKWSYIGFFILVQGILSIVDSGLIIGFIKAFSEEKENGNAFLLLKTVERLIYFFSLVLIIIIFIITSILFFINFYINLDENLIFCLIGGVCFYLGNLISLPHKGFLISHNFQNQNYMISALMISTRHIVTVLIMKFIPTILILFFTNIICIF